MRIAIFSDNFYPEMSGISDSILTLAKEIIKRGHYVNFYVPRYSKENYKRVGAGPKELQLGDRIKIMRLFSLPYPTGTNQGRLVIPTGLRWLGVKKFNPDIIHTNLFSGAGVEALITARVLKKPLVGTNHTAIKEFLRYSPIHGAWLDNLVLRYVSWYHNQCKLTTAPSRSVIDEMKIFGFSGESHVVSNPIDTNVFHPLQNKNWLKKKFGFGEFAVVHAGRLAAERSVDVIIKAMALVKKAIPEAKLVLAGSGAAEKNLRQLALTLDLRDAVKFMGFVDKVTLNEIYNASKIFVITSIADTQSMVMMQAMAAGLPVIGVKARAFPEYVSLKSGILVEPGDEKAVAASIVKLLKGPASRKKLGEGSRKFATNFSAPEITGHWETIYEKVIKDYNKSS